MLNNSTINTTTFEIGAHGLLTGNDGVINATGDVIVGGTISPGNSPGRVTINCNLITLPGSMLVLDILGSGGGFQHRSPPHRQRLDLQPDGLHVVFNFLGDTDPNAFAATGGFDMDNFLQSLNLQTGEVTGLSTVFAPARPGATCRRRRHHRGVARLRLQRPAVAADGTVTVVAAPCRSLRPGRCWSLGLLGVGSMAQRRALARRR